MQVQKVIRNKLVSMAGFTLTEVLVGLCLFALLSGFFLHCFVFAMNQYHHSIALMELEDNLGNAMDWLSADLADTIAVLECKADGLSLQTAEKKIYYTTGTDTQAKEHFYDLTGKIFYRREHTQKNRQPMANFITGFYITYYDEKGTLTSYAANVKMVEILLEGTWNDTVLSKRLAVRLSGSDYL
jgi:hypothetical protein